MTSMLRTVAIVLLLACAAHAQAGSPPADAKAIDPEALALTRRAGDFLRDAERFTFTAVSGWDVVQEDGVKFEFGATRRYAVEHPGRVRVETESRDGARRLTLFDGKSLVHLDLDENAYARADLKQPRDLDFVVDLLRDRLDMALPLGELLRNNPRAAIEDSLVFAERVGGERMRGTPVAHLALGNADADVQLWIAEEGQPLLRRVVITYRTLEGEPSFWADLDEWAFPEKLPDGAFRFDPPAGAVRVQFDVRPAPEPTEEAAR
jgi:hypothetical protein